MNLDINNNPILYQYVKSTMEKRKGHIVHNFWFKCELKSVGFGKSVVVFKCSGDDNERNGMIFVDQFVINTKDLEIEIREFKLLKLLSI